MTNASANTNAHHHAHSHSGDDPAHGAGDVAQQRNRRESSALPDSEHSSLEFLTSVRSLKEAEKSAAAKVEGAKKDAARIEAQAREKAVEMQAKASEKAVAAKNELLAEGKRKTDAEIKEILDETHKQAAKIKAKRLAEKDVQVVSEHVL